MEIRKAARQDVSAINDIYNYYVAHTAITWRWRQRTPDEALAWFARHQTPQHCAYVAHEGQDVVGFASLSPFREADGYWPVAENSVYVRPGWEKRGIGRALMQTLVGAAKQTDLRSIVAVLDAENQGSRKFHLQLGFVPAGMLHHVGDKFGQPRSVEFLQLEINKEEPWHSRSIHTR
ncbi:MAG: GNAT family N-acetyltransferase [Eubacteriales bacterium]|nr:GNAT family N-acetyltransferase [Eubacteriales bacterium]